MTVQYIAALPPARQERLFDAWLLLRRDPSASRRRSREIADAMVHSALEVAREAHEACEGLECGVDIIPWYRRYRLARRAGRGRSTRVSAVAVRAARSKR